MLAACSRLPPVAALYQLTDRPLAEVTVRVGRLVFSQITGLLGLPGAVTEGQLQLGAFIFWVSIQPDADVRVSTILVSAGIWSMVNRPFIPFTIPALLLRVTAVSVWSVT